MGEATFYQSAIKRLAVAIGLARLPFGCLIAVAERTRNLFRGPGGRLSVKILTCLTKAE